MMRSTLGAPLGGTTVGGQYGLDCSAPRLMTPPKFGDGGGRYLPSMVVVALGEPGTPLICWAPAGPQTRTGRSTTEKTTVLVFHLFPTTSPSCRLAAPLEQDTLPKDSEPPIWTILHWLVCDAASRARYTIGCAKGGVRSR